MSQRTYVSTYWSKSINKREIFVFSKVSAILYKRRLLNFDFITGHTVAISIMNTLTAILLCVLAVVAFAAPPNLSQNYVIPIVASHLDGPNPDGSYSYLYQTGNGIQAQEQGQLVKISKDEDANRVQGSFSYSDDDGNPINLSYSADENGFHPSGEHLPVAPPVPEAIIRSLEYIAQHPEEDNL